MQKTGVTKAIDKEWDIFEHETLQAALGIWTLFGLNLRGNSLSYPTE